MDKKIVDGRVAVLVSHGYGAGWYSWNTKHPELLFDPAIVDMVLTDRQEKDLDAYLESKYGEDHGIYQGGVDDLRVHWVEQGRRFRIHEYDGAESLVLDEDDTWHVA